MTMLHVVVYVKVAAEPDSLWIIRAERRHSAGARRRIKGSLFTGQETSRERKRDNGPQGLPWNNKQEDNKRAGRLNWH